MAALKVTNRQCPVCAGVVAFDGSRRLGHCRYCSARLLFPDNQHCPRYLVEPKMTAEDLPAVISGALAGGRVAKDFAQNLQPETVRLVFLPLYEVKGTTFVAIEEQLSPQQVAGKQRKQGTVEVFGEEDDEGRVRDTSLRLRNICYHEFAVGDAGFGLDAIDCSDFATNTLRFRRPFDANLLPTGARVFSPDSPPEEIEARFKTQSGRKQVKRGVSSRLFATEISLNFFPFYIACYSYGGTMYRFVVDGTSGQIIRGRAPENLLWASWLAQSILLVAALVSYALVQFLTDTGVYRQLSGLGMAVTIVFSLVPLALLYGVWLRLWLGREVVVINGKVHLQSLEKQEASLLTGLADFAEGLLHFAYRSVFGRGAVEQ